MITLILEHSATGESVSRTENGDWPGWGYIWSEGNYACDCNRYLFFWRWQGIEPGDIGDHDCGDTDYRLSAIDATGEVYRD